MKILITVLLLLISVQATAAGGGANLESAETNIRSKDSLRNGAKLYMNYCSSCHSLQYQRYKRMGEDLGLTEEEVEENLILTGAKYTSHMTINMNAEDSERWFGKAPIDLSVIARARGNDWLFSYLKGFYKDPTRPSGWNNTVFKNASMPNVLWQQQGIQAAHFKEQKHDNGIVTYEFKNFTKLTSGNMSDAEFDTAVRDIVNFLDYTSEPAKLIRMQYAPWVLLFMVLLVFMTYLLKVNYFKDIH